VSKANKKLWKDPEYREKVIEGRKRSWAKDTKRKEAAAKRFREVSQKTYVLQNPDGAVVSITNLQEFCRQSSVTLVPSQLSLVARGLKPYYKGWVLPGNEGALPKPTIHKFRSPDGEVVEIANLAEFAKKLGVHRSSVTNVVHKSTSNVNGWTLFDQVGVPKSIHSPKGLVSPEGVAYKFTSTKIFCEEHPAFKLNRSKVSLLLNDHIKSYKGWTKP